MGQLIKEGYTIKQIVNKIGKSKQTIQFWIISTGIEAEIKSGGKGFERLFSKSNIIELFMIKKLQDIGKDLNDINKIFALIRFNCLMDFYKKDIDLYYFKKTYSTKEGNIISSENIYSENKIDELYRILIDYINKSYNIEVINLGQLKKEILKEHNF